MNHDLDIHPIPEKVLYINELGIADMAFYYNTEEQHQKVLTGRTRTNGGILKRLLILSFMLLSMARMVTCLL